MKSCKGDVMKHDQLKGNSARNDTGPLFPRLHVNKTERAGPRAPPRNKMALYEQFTIPSHRFVQHNRTSSSSPHQQQIQYGSNEYQYPYLPCYVPSPMIYGNSQIGIPVYGQPAYGAGNGGMSCSSTVITEDEAEKVSRKLSSGVSRVILSRDGGSSTMKNTSGKKAKDDSDSSVHVVPCATGHDKTIPGTTDCTQTTVSPDVTHIRGGWQQAQIVNVRSEFPHLESQLSEVPCVENHEENLRKMVENGRSRCVCVSTDKHDAGSDSLPMIPQVPQQSTQIDAEQSESQVKKSEKYEEISNSSELKNNDNISLEEQRVSIVDLKSIFGNDQVTESSQYQCLIRSKFHKNGENGSSDGRNASVTVVMNRGDVTGVSVGNQNIDTEASEPSMHGTGNSGNSDDTAISVIAHKLSLTIKPKDVIRVVGQQQFWKARKALLRQQRIFSDQVFQLHKLIKVQQLLAETPGTLINEEIQFGSIDESDNSPHSNLMDGANCCIEQGQTHFECGAESQKYELEAQPEKVSSNLESHQSASKDGELKVSVSSSHQGAVTAWGYPSIGMGQWMSPIAMHGRPFIQQHVSVPPFGGQCGSSVPGQMSHMFPFGIPCYDQRLMEMQQNHGSRASFNNYVSQNPSNIQNDISGCWNFMSYNPFHYQGLHSVPSDKDGPTGSGASVNQSPNLPGRRTTSVPSIQRQLRMKLHTVDDDLSVCDNSRVNRNASACTQSNSSRKSSCDLNDDVNRALYHHHSSFQDDDRALKYGGSDKVTSWSKGEQEQTSDTCMTHSGNGVHLFQLVSSSLHMRDKVNIGKSDGQVIKAVPHPAIETSKSAAGILRSLQRERQQ